jgi:hypothetical protein
LVEAFFMRTLWAATAAFLLAGTALPVMAQPPRPLTLTRDERTAISALANAAAGPDRAAQDAALATARAAARGPDAHYAIAHYQLEIGRARGDAALQSQAVDALVDSGLATPQELPSLLANQASRAYSQRDMARSERLMQRAIEAQPNNAMALADYAHFKARVRTPGTASADRAMSVSLFARAIAAAEASGAPAAESLYRHALDVAYDGTQRINGAPALAPQVAPQVVQFGQKLVGAYPSPANWRDALLAYRDVAGPDPALVLDIRRLMRAADAVAGERDYLDLAAAFTTAGLGGEAKAVLDEGVSRGELDPAKPAIAAALTAATRRATADRATLAALRTRAAAGTGAQARAAADSFYGFGQYADAAALYQAALQKGGEDPNLVNLRLGAAFALAGQRPQAEAALHAVTGPRADLAGYWLTWLAHRPAAA